MLVLLVHSYLTSLRTLGVDHEVAHFNQQLPMPYYSLSRVPWLHDVTVRLAFASCCLYTFELSLVQYACPCTTRKQNKLRVQALDDSTSLHRRRRTQLQPQSVSCVSHTIDGNLGLNCGFRFDPSNYFSVAPQGALLELASRTHLCLRHPLARENG